MFVGSSSKHLSDQVALEQVGPFETRPPWEARLPRQLFLPLAGRWKPGLRTATLSRQAFLVKVQLRRAFIRHESFPFLFSKEAPLHQKHVGEACSHLGKGLCWLFSEGEVQIREGWAT